MRRADLSPDAIEKIKRHRYDRIIEKHEGPERWSDVLGYYDPDFLEIAGRHVLLPIGREHHPNVTVLRCVVGDGGAVLTLFLRDTTYGQEWYDSGFLALCEKVPGEGFFLATVYHEWFVIENQAD